MVSKNRATTQTVADAADSGREGKRAARGLSSIDKEWSI